MRIGLHTVYSGKQYKDNSGIIIQTKIMRQLIIGPLQERRVYSEYRGDAVFRGAAAHCDGVFFRDPDVNKTPLCLPLRPFFADKTERPGRSGGQHERPVIVPEKIDKAVVNGRVADRESVFRQTVFYAERRTGMPAFAVLLGIPQPLTLDGMYMQNDGMIRVFDALISQALQLPSVRFF